MHNPRLISDEELFAIERNSDNELTLNLSFTIRTLQNSLQKTTDEYCQYRQQKEQFIKEELQKQLDQIKQYLICQLNLR
jgi:uncharacterized HAD superfamily protein